MAETSQQWNAEVYARNARFVSSLGEPVLELLSPKPGERILDVGCGDGVLTKRIVDAGAIVTAVDHSPEMIAASQTLGLDARIADATALPFEKEFDAVFTNATLHWVKAHPEACVAGAFRALKPGGRFVGEFGGHGCVAAVVVALLAELERRGIADAAAKIPWYFPSAEEYRAQLERAGFHVDYVAVIPRPTPLPTGMRGWLSTFANRFCDALPQEERDPFLDDVTARLVPVLCNSQGRWTADYTRLRFKAIRSVDLG
jgi:trans-aconitate methyltransferase